MVKKTQKRGLWVLLGFSGLSLGATATFTPLGSTTVTPGMDVHFDITVSVATLSTFDAADVVIGSNAGSLTFNYAPEWDQAFLNVTVPLGGVGFYPADVFVGGNNPSAIGASLKMGTVSLHTQRLPPGTYSVQVNNVVDQGVSKLSRGDLRDPLIGSSSFTVLCASTDSDCDGDIDLVDSAQLPSCLLGPAIQASAPCQQFDYDQNDRVDLREWHNHLSLYTGN